MFIVLALLIPDIKLKGAKKIKISYNQKYKEPGFNAKFLFKNVSKNVKIKGEVNTSKIGEYTLIYELKKGI